MLALEDSSEARQKRALKARSSVAGEDPHDRMSTAARALARDDADRQPLSSDGVSEQPWGIAAAGRVASVPFALGRGDDTVSSFVPMLFFENDVVFLRGTEGGVYFLNEPETPIKFSGLSRLRFVDLPADAQNSSQTDSLDFGFQLR